MSSKVVFPYLLRAQHNDHTYMPYVPVLLQLNLRTLQSHALVDSDSSVNVLPYSLGLQLGADWNKQQISLELGGNLAHVSSKGLLLTVALSPFSPIRLAFAWAETDQVPLIFGQMNFFQEFDVCFLRAELRFEIGLRNQE